ncbi:MAG: uracil phosphoribosyltransferase [Opitutaceae bacterium]
MSIELSSHPLVRHYLTTLRDKETEEEAFRKACTGITTVLIAEAAKQLELDTFSVQTPLESTEGARITGEVVFVPVLRAGLGMLDAAMAVIPGSSVGYIGLERDEATAEASCYYSKMPELGAAQIVYVIDPMLATGGSAIKSIDLVKAQGATRISMVSIIAAPEGIEALQTAHPDVTIMTGAIDRELDENKYIRPGLGDFGDRLFRT